MRWLSCLAVEFPSYDYVVTMDEAQVYIIKRMKHSGLQSQEWTTNNNKKFIWAMKSENIREKQANKTEWCGRI